MTVKESIWINNKNPDAFYCVSRSLSKREHNIWTIQEKYSNLIQTKQRSDKMRVIWKDNDIIFSG